MNQALAPAILTLTPPSCTGSGSPPTLLMRSRIPQARRDTQFQRRGTWLIPAGVINTEPALVIAFWGGASSPTPNKRRQDGGYAE